jgi:hypothetical protein
MDGIVIDNEHRATVLHIGPSFILWSSAWESGRKWSSWFRKKSILGVSLSRQVRQVDGRGPRAREKRGA